MILLLLWDINDWRRDKKLCILHQRQILDSSGADLALGQNERTGRFLDQQRRIFDASGADIALGENERNEWSSA